MAFKLQTLLPPTRSGRTFVVASTLLGIGAGMQLVLMGIFLLRASHAPYRPATPQISFAETIQPAMPAVDTLPPPPMAVPTPVPAAVADATAPPPALPGGELTRPTPAPAGPVEGPGVSLVEQARQLRIRGDMPSALAKLREAQNTEPENAQVIAEMALTYEAMQLPDRAFEQWQRLFNMGDSIGALYYLADARLHAAPPAPPSAAQAPASAMGGLMNGPSATQETTVLKITDIHLDEVPDENAEKKLVLKIVVKDRPGSAIDPTKVRILTYFYDLIDGKDIVLTDAQTAYAWVTPAPINWAGDKSEILETTYLRPKASAATPATPAAPTPAARNSRRGSRGKKAESDAATPEPSATPAAVRTYLGYVVRLYYDRQLQDVQADPVRLLQQFPPPLTLPAE